MQYDRSLGTGAFIEPALLGSLLGLLRLTEPGDRSFDPNFGILAGGNGWVLADGGDRCHEGDR